MYFPVNPGAIQLSSIPAAAKGAPTGRGRNPAASNDKALMPRIMEQNPGNVLIILIVGFNIDQGVLEGQGHRQQACSYKERLQIIVYCGGKSVGHIQDDRHINEGKKDVRPRRFTVTVGENCLYHPRVDKNDNNEYENNQGGWADHAIVEMVQQLSCP